MDRLAGGFLRYSSGADKEPPKHQARRGAKQKMFASRFTYFCLSDGNRYFSLLGVSTDVCRRRQR